MLSLRPQSISRLTSRLVTLSVSMIRLTASSSPYTAGVIVARPVVHFEIIGTAPQRLRDYYGQLFGWQLDTPSPVADEVSDPEDYGFLDLVALEDGTGIRGGIGGGPGFAPHALFYVAVPDVEAALQQAEALGGTRVLGPVRSPSGLVVGQFTDPEGTLIGVAGIAG
jgi:uncharacterized protein